MSGIYLHIPFCKQACHYCDFYFSTNQNHKNELVQAICGEIKQRYRYLPCSKLNSIYFGGGTPSLLNSEELQAIFKTLQEYFSYDNTTEITLEANPDDITTANLLAWKNVGINRLSIGLQSFNNGELKWMNRAHTAQESVSSVKLAQDLGFTNITIDLIYGSKFQTLQSWEETLKKAIALNTQHISAYNLTIEDKTALGLKHKKGKEPAVNDELSSQQFLLMKQLFEESGFIHYEISNFGKPNFFAQHNSNYWLQKPYLGIGPSAHSFNGISRQWNVRNNAQYSKAITNNTTYFEKEELRLEDRYNEYVLTRLRTIWGCHEEEIKNLFGTKIADHFNIAVLQKKEYLDCKNGIYSLNAKGLLQADGIASHLFIL
jgi:oxygen-independent coproporphyrinogen III oxidase